jgi:hypothetical protein
MLNKISHSCYTASSCYSPYENLNMALIFFHISRESAIDIEYHARSMRWIGPFLVETWFLNTITRQVLIKESIADTIARDRARETVNEQFMMMLILHVYFQHLQTHVKKYISRGSYQYYIVSSLGCIRFHHQISERIVCFVFSCYERQATHNHVINTN